MENLRILVYETDPRMKKKLTDALKSNGRVVEVIETKFAEAVDALIWKTDLKLDGVIVGYRAGSEEEKDEGLRIMAQQAYRLTGKIKFYFHLSGDCSRLVEEYGVHGNIDRDLKDEDYLKQFSGLF